jgi:uncharacterized protein (DUF58 family)
VFRFWSRFRSGLDLSPRHQVTRLGLLFTLVWVVVALAAFASANNLLFLILALLLATLMISGFISRLSLAGLELDFRVPEHICAGRKFVGRIVVHNTKSWMPSFSIRITASGASGLQAPIYFPTIPGGSILEEPVAMYFPARGAYRQSSFRLSTRFPFGFAERRIQVPLRREILVYPSIDPKPGFEDLLLALQGELESFHRGRGHDFYRIRPYEALESARHVDWRATAHTGDLQVREFTTDQELSVAFFIDLDVSSGAETWFENAVDCCAYLAWSLTQRGASVRFATQEVDWQLPGGAEVYTVLKYLATVAPRTGKPLEPVNDRNVFRMVFSAAPDRLAQNGWDLSDNRVRVLGLEHAVLTRPARAAEQFKI